MVAYSEFIELSQSGDSDARGQAAHMAAQAYLNHVGPADEQAALYAALVGFLDDPSVKVRAALAYALLHAREAPRPIMLALMADSAVIARAVAQYSPVLIDADLLALIRRGDSSLLVPMALRQAVSPRLAEALLATGDRATVLTLLERPDLTLTPEQFARIAEGLATDDAHMRGLLLARADLPAPVRLKLVQVVALALRQLRVVKGAVAPERLERLLQRATDGALAAIGEHEAGHGRTGFAAAAVSAEQINARVMIHAVVNGHILFFAACITELSGVRQAKVYALLDKGGRAALNALLARCGLGPASRQLLARLIQLARMADLADDVAARHFVVTALTEELIAEHDGDIPTEIEDAFAYLSEQNVMLARQAARGVMAGFARDEAAAARAMLEQPGAELPVVLPAA
jgi:uncharacterized protein (DUF2336 family)